MKPLVVIKKQRELFELLDQHNTGSGDGTTLGKANVLMLAITGRGLTMGDKLDNYIVQLNELIRLTVDDFNLLSRDDYVRKFNDIKDQQTTIMFKLNKLDQIREYAQLFVDVAANISMIRVSLTAFKETIDIDPLTLNDAEGSYYRQHNWLKTQIKAIDDISKKRLKANPRRDVALRAVTSILSVESELFEKADEFEVANDDLVVSRELNNKAQSALDLLPQEEFSRVMRKGTDFLISNGISVDANSPQLDTDEEYVERINRLIDTPEFRAEMLNFVGTKEAADGVCRMLRGSTMVQALGHEQINQKLFDMITTTKPNSHDDIIALGQPLFDLTNQLIASSPISDEQASEFSNNLVFDEQAIDDLEVGGYAGSQGHTLFKSDLSDLYKLTAGKIYIKKFSGAGSDERAHYNPKKDTVFVKENLERSTLWHELSHSLEYKEPKILVAVKAFLNERLEQARAKGSDIKPLYEIYKGMAFDEEEIAIEDGAFSHYVTKIYVADESKPISAYNIITSEVISMGIEALSHPLLAGKLLNKDPRHAAFIMGIILDCRGNE